MRTKQLVVLIFSLLNFYSLNANNLEIGNMYLRGQNDAEGYKMIRMDVSWDNSWRTST